MEMSRELFFKSSKFLAVLSIFVGCALQTFSVTIVYFKYRTSTAISIQDYPEEHVKAPSFVMCIRFDIDPSVQSVVGQIFSSDYFNDRNDTWKVVNMKGKVTSAERLEHSTKKYIMNNKYCMFVKVKNYFSMEEVMSPRFGTLPYFYTFSISTEPLHSNYSFIRVRIDDSQKSTTWKPVYFQVVSDESTMFNPRNRFVFRDIHTSGVDSYRIRLSYSLSVNVRLPPPYDSNCIDYGKDGHFMSSHHCFDKCLKNESKQWNIVPGMTTIDRRSYQNSNMDIAPSNIIEDHERMKVLMANRTLPDKLLDTYRVVHSRWRGIKRSCHQSCNRPDCLSERITPQMTSFEAGPTMDNGTMLSQIMVRVIPSNQPIVRVTCVPEKNLIDLIVYICSGVSFWLGFCPLNVVSKMDSRLRECAKIEHWKKRKRSSVVEVFRRSNTHQ